MCMYTYIYIYAYIHSWEFVFDGDLPYYATFVVFVLMMEVCFITRWRKT